MTRGRCNGKRAENNRDNNCHLPKITLLIMLCNLLLDKKPVRVQYVFLTQMYVLVRMMHAASPTR